MPVAFLFDWLCSFNFTHLKFICLFNGVDNYYVQRIFRVNSCCTVGCYISHNKTMFMVYHEGRRPLPVPDKTITINQSITSIKFASEFYHISTIEVLHFPMENNCTHVFYKENDIFIGLFSIFN